MFHENVMPHGRVAQDHFVAVFDECCWLDIILHPLELELENDVRPRALSGCRTLARVAARTNAGARVPWYRHGGPPIADGACVN